MAKGKLFEYAVLYHPKTKKNASGEVIEEKKSEIVTDVTRILAVSEVEVSIVAARSIKEDFLGKLEDVEIIVRPF
jgi:hypothetical protein